MVDLLILLLIFLIESFCRWLVVSWKVTMWLCKMVGWCMVFALTAAWTIAVMVFQGVVWLIGLLFKWVASKIIN